MDEKESQSIERHVAGATVVHRSPFNNLTTLQNTEHLDKGFIDRFAAPFYLKIMSLGTRKNQLQSNVKKIYNDINPEVVSKLLGDFNWRTRSVGAFFAAIKSFNEFQDPIGGLLLKSEVCYAGTSYCLALAEFNNQKSIDYINQYLDYYLKQKDLWFDQEDAMGAIAYLDKNNGTNELMKHLYKWTEFVSGKENLSLKTSIANFEKKMLALKEIKNYAS